MSNDVVYKYNAKKNPKGRGIAGVPAGRDLTADDIASLPDWVIRTIEACEFYETPKPAPKKKRASKKKAEPIETELADKQALSDPAETAEGGDQ